MLDCHVVLFWALERLLLSAKSSFMLSINLYRRRPRLLFPVISLCVRAYVRACV